MQPRDLLNHPALTGLDPAGLTALAAALQIPFRARREQKYHLRRGRRRVNAIRRAGPHGNLRTDVTGHVLILRLRDHLCLTAKAAAVLFGIHPTSVSHAVTLTRRLIGENAIPVPAAAGPRLNPSEQSMTCVNTPASTESRYSFRRLRTTVPQKPH